MVADDSTLTIVVSEGGYTHNELLQVYEEIVNTYMKPAGESPVMNVGIGWTSIDGVVTGFGESNRESRVVVGVLAEYVDEYRELFQKKYGDIVVVKTVSGKLEEVSTAYAWDLWDLRVLLCAAAAVVLLRLCRRAFAARTKGGRRIGAGELMTARQLEDAVVEMTEAPDGKVYQRILKKLNVPEDMT